MSKAILEFVAKSPPRSLHSPHRDGSSACARIISLIFDLWKSSMEVVHTARLDASCSIIMLRIRMKVRDFASKFPFSSFLAFSDMLSIENGCYIMHWASTYDNMDQRGNHEKQRRSFIHFPTYWNRLTLHIICHTQHIIGGSSEIMTSAENISNFGDGYFQVMTWQHSHKRLSNQFGETFIQFLSGISIGFIYTVP